MSYNQETRQMVLERDVFVCQLCGLLKRLDVHHIIPRIRNGSNEPNNLISLCRSCHKKIEPKREPFEKIETGFTTIRIEESTKHRLDSHGKKGETYEQIIQRLMECAN